MKTEHVLLKRDTPILYKGVPMRFVGIREGGEKATLEAWIDVPLSEIEIVEESQYKQAELSDHSEDYLYHLIHKQIREQLKDKNSISEEELEALVKEGLGTGLKKNSLDEIKEGQRVAVHYLDNWDGEEDRYFIIAYKEDGVLKSEESHEDLFRHVGDKIIEWWPLNIGNGNVFKSEDSDKSYKCETCEYDECNGGCEK